MPANAELDPEFAQLAEAVLAASLPLTDLAEWERVYHRKPTHDEIRQRKQLTRDKLVQILLDLGLF